MRQILIELHVPGDSENAHFFILNKPTPGEPNFYPQAVSYDWFRDRDLTRAFPEVSSGKLINGLDWMQYARTVKYCSEHQPRTQQGMKAYLDDWGVDINTVPVCNGVWELYQAIGYDRKSKKYKSNT